MDLIEQIRRAGREALLALDNVSVWVGTPESHAQARELALSMVSLPDAELLAIAGSVDLDDRSSLLQVQGKVGVIPIQGPLIKTDSIYSRLFGLTSYAQIREAAVEAANDPQVEHILLHVDSPGGHVVGLQETSTLLQSINANVKPISTFTSGTMASAAYWLGVNGKSITATSDATVGSIGILAVHKEESKRLEAEGVKTTVIRAGKYKALVNPYEPLSAAGRTQLQEKVDAQYKVFVEHVAKQRRVTYAEADKNMAQGREFEGEEAVRAGLIDRVSTFAQVLKALDSQYAVDITRRMYKNPLRNTKGAIPMTEQELAALLLGATPAEASAAPGAAAPSVAAPAAPADPVVTEAAAPAAPAAPVAPAATEAVVPAAPAAPVTDGTTGLLAFLQAQVKEKDTQLLSLALEARDLKTKVDSMEVTHGPLFKIAQHSVNTMRVAMGGSAVDLSAVSPVALLEEHQKLTVDFTSRFKVGGVAATAPAAPAPEGEATAGPRDSAKITAVRFGKRK